MHSPDEVLKFASREVEPDPCVWVDPSGSRRLAVTADTELRRRHPDQTIEHPLSAEPEAATDTQRDGELSETPTRIRDLS